MNLTNITQLRRKVEKKVESSNATFSSAIQLSDQQEDKFIFVFRLLDEKKYNILRASDIRILGEAIAGRPPSEADVKLQVHRLRVRCFTSTVIDNCIQCISDLQRNFLCHFYILFVVVICIVNLRVFVNFLFLLVIIPTIKRIN